MLCKSLLQYEATNSDFLSCCQLPFVSNGMLVSLQGYWWPCNIYALLEIPRVVLSICPLHSPGQLWSHPSHGPLLFVIFSLLLTALFFGSAKASFPHLRITVLILSTHMDLSTLLSGFYYP